jgi:glycosyltransferase involved in cell wall biosynthesis
MFILKLKSDRQLAEKMGNASRQYLQSHFTLEIIAKQYIKALEQAIN